MIRTGCWRRVGLPVLLALVAASARAACERDLALEPAALTIHGAPPSSALPWPHGVAVADFDGSGILDLAMGAPLANDPWTGTLENGRVDVFLDPLAGAPERWLRTNMADVVVGPPAATPFTLFGSAVAAGDLDGDGDADLAFLMMRPANRRSVFVFLAPFSPMTRVDLTSRTADAEVLLADADAGFFGWSLALGDLDGDGANDLALGSTALRAGWTGGSVLVLRGPFAAGEIRDLRTGVVDTRITGPPGPGIFGEVVVVADADGDGQLDLAIGSPSADPDGDMIPEGRVDVLRGPLPSGTVDLGVAPPWMSVTGGTGSRLGLDLAMADVDGNGAADLVVGVPGHVNDPSPVPGAVEVLLGPLAPGPRDLTAAPAELRVLGSRAGSSFGYSVAVGDVTGDGRADLVAGAPDWMRPGEVHVVAGPLAAGLRDLAAAPAWMTVRGAEAGDRLGLALVLADLQADGIADLVAGAVGAEGGNGAVHVLTLPVEPDADGDTVPDGCDACPLVPDPGQQDADGDTVGDACDPCPIDPSDLDTDMDGICTNGGPDACPDMQTVGCNDNCPSDANPLQEDQDGDRDGDACDPCPSDPANVDADLDSICDDGGPVPCMTMESTGCDDNCPGVYNPQQEDSDGDGVGDACDPEPCREPSAVDLVPSAPPLRIARAGSDLVVTWETLPGEEQSVYAGTLSSLHVDRAYDHAPAACRVAGGATTIPAPPEDAYLLVVTSCAALESPYGRDSAGAERPSAVVRCP